MGRTLPLFVARVFGAAGALLAGHCALRARADGRGERPDRARGGVDVGQPNHQDDAAGKRAWLLRSGRAFSDIAGSTIRGDGASVEQGTIYRDVSRYAGAP